MHRLVVENPLIEPSTKKIGESVGRLGVFKPPLVSYSIQNNIVGGTLTAFAPSRLRCGRSSLRAGIQTPTIKSLFNHPITP
jgi:hypothetical protein